MGLLHRVYAASVTDVWATEGRLLHTLGLVRRPVAAQWLVTAACDMTCPHCYSAAGKRGRDELSTEQAKRLVIDALVDLGCPMLVLAGGELLLRRDIPELVRYACERGLSWSMHTHGMHVPRVAELIATHPPALAAISLDGDRSFHDAFRGRAGSFDAALDAARILADAGCREVVLGTTVTRDNADAIADMFPLVARSRAHSWGLHLFAPEGRGHDHAELFATPAQLRRVAAFARRRRGQFPIELCNEWGSAGAEDLYYRDQPFSCGAGTISFVISANGDVLPCTTTDPAEREGNVRATPLREIWARRFERFRSGTGIERGECWLQTRNGVRCSEAAFGPVARPQPLWVERWPQTVVARTRGTIIGQRSAAAVSLAAAGLVFLQGCVKTTPAPAPDPNAQPNAQPEGALDGSDAEGDARWSVQRVSVPARFPSVLQRNPGAHFVAQQPSSEWSRLRTALLACESDAAQCQAARTYSTDTADLAAAFAPYIDALEARHEPLFHEAIAVLDAMELHPLYDSALAGQLWRSVRALQPSDPVSSQARARLFARLQQHHRVIDALKRAELAHGPVHVRPWLKKSMPPPGFDPLLIPKGLMDTAAAAHPEASAGTWDTLGVAMTLHGRGARLAHAGRVTSVRDGATVRLSRLDILWSGNGATLTDEVGRVLVLPARTEVTLFELSSWLPDQERTELDARVRRALDGDETAADALERELPLAHAALRAGLHEQPSAVGAARLRMILVQLDE